MKTIFSYYCIITTLCINFNASCADNNHVDHIDKLALYHAASGNGKEILKKAIATHTSKQYLLPFEIWFQVSASDYSYFSYMIFNVIESNYVVKPKNFRNLSLTTHRPELIPISQCTYYRKRKNSEKTVDVVAFFFNREKLSALYNELERYLESEIDTTESSD